MSNKRDLAVSAYRQICAALDERNWNYKKEDEKLLVAFGVSGDDLPMQMIIFVDEERQVIRLLSNLSFRFPEEKRLEGAVAACVASYTLANGNFDFDIASGDILFRLVNTFRDSQISTALIQYMISCACSTVDRYNDQFLALSKGMITIEQFINAIKQN